MDSVIRDRATRRFDDLRDKALQDYAFDPALAAVPGGWCLSAIARLVRNAPELVPFIQNMQQELTQLQARLYLYPEESLHISLLGCTQREARPPTTSPRRVRVVRNAVAQMLDKASPVTVELGRLNLIGNQVFVEVYTDQSAWAELRRQLGERLQADGEQPMVYPDAEPMHLNIARIESRPDTSALHSMLDATPSLASTFSIRVVELVLTDFLVSRQETEVLEMFALSKI